MAARECEDAERRLFYDFDCDDNPIDHSETREEIALAFVRYRHALARLKAAYPNELNDCSSRALVSTAGPARAAKVCEARGHGWCRRLLAASVRRARSGHA